ncbi:MAG: signal peptide peptidase SppA [Bacteroidaceae bacterium]|nr:signal peptide peptidase SppA [Paraprevotella sp.]MDY4615436.1 signal peptide peptidase SppA [Bacteroidaceae bacterium]MDY4787527.1 signal peptide peptidase SppA [Bacteroidaceae bacterium]MDY4998104.1 signal peptide peptidase SppA [Bacteroidaceae bacterium]MDY5962978.1 signal peptide peptidase SppA [Bacteroidaceae bacterium]
MKDFIKYTMATVVGLVLVSIIMGILTFVSMAGMIASEGMSSPIEKKSVLRITLKGSITERAGEENPLSKLGGETTQQIALDQALQALEKAAKNDKIEGIYMEGGILSAYPAEVQELRQALLKFKKSGKWIIAYADTYSRSAYYLCSVADKVYLNPIGMLDWSGLSSNPMFFTGLMKKLGIKMQVFKVGTYKSAVEPYIAEQMSDANREQVSSYQQSIWNNMLKDVAKSRKTTAEALNSLADSLTILSGPEASVKGGLVDKLCYQDEVKKILKNKAKMDEDESLRFVSISDVALSEELNDKVDDEIAVYYAYGEIKEDITGGFAQESAITSKQMTKDLQELREDDDVKAVVLRVNSPGGSAYASEQIWREVQLLSKEKPVIVSMGALAASGGYYISCGANKIFAEPTTLTGSIGIFGMIPDATELLTDKLGLSFDVVKTNAHSDFGAMGRPLNESECRLMQAYINQGYELFTGRVAQGRKISQDSVKAVAEGRVWTGEQAMKIGLVDKLGNLNDAIAAAAKAAKIEKYSVGRYPEPAPWFASLLQEKKADYMDSQMRSALGEFYPAFSLIRDLKNQDAIQARMTFIPDFR